MTSKSPLQLESLWDIEDEFGALVGTAIGTVHPVAGKQDKSRSKTHRALLKKRSNGHETSDRASAEKTVFRGQALTPLSQLTQDPTDLSSRDLMYQLSSVYWRPIFTFIHRRGHSVWDAQDLTQDFFLSVLEGKFFREEDLTTGRFRAVLLQALKHFLRDAKRVTKHNKRSNIQFVSWGDWIAESPSTIIAPKVEVTTWTPERTFDIGWAATIAERSLRRLAEECAIKGRRRVFDVLNNWLTAERSDVDYVGIAKRLNITEPATKTLLHHFRQRYRTLLRQEVAETVESGDHIDEEIRYLCRVLAEAEKENKEPVWNKWLSAQRKALAAIQAELWSKAHLSRVRV